MRLGKDSGVYGHFFYDPCEKFGSVDTCKIDCNST